MCLPQAARRERLGIERREQLIRGMPQLAGDQVRLAPLYDVASALPYGTHERRLRFAMKIGDDYAVFRYRSPWPGIVFRPGNDRILPVSETRQYRRSHFSRRRHLDRSRRQRSSGWFHLTDL